MIREQTYWALKNIHTHSEDMPAITAFMQNCIITILTTVGQISRISFFPGYPCNLLLSLSSKDRYLRPFGRT